MTRQRRSSAAEDLMALVALHNVDDQSHGVGSVCGTALPSMRKTDGAARGEARCLSRQNFLEMLSVF